MADEDGWITWRKTLPNISAIDTRILGGDGDSVDATELDLTKLPDTIVEWEEDLHKWELKLGRRWDDGTKVAITAG